MRLDLLGICVSPGAACSARNPRPSHALLAMGYPERRARESVRFSIGRLTTMDEIEDTIRAVTRVFKKER